MFSLASGLYSEYFSPQQINLLIVGVQGSGKTTILERIKVTDFATQSVTTLSSLNQNHIRHRSLVNDTAIAAAAAAAAVTAAQSSKEYRESNQSNRYQSQQQPQHNARQSKVSTIGPSPEVLRSKIFFTDTVDDYQAPTTKRRRMNPNPKNSTSVATTSSMGPNSGAYLQQQPLSRFGWICPPVVVPKFTSSFLLSKHNSRLDTSDRSSDNNMNVRHEFSNDAMDMLLHDEDANQFWEDDDDADHINDDDDDDIDDPSRNSDVGSTTMDTTLLSTNTTASARSRRSTTAITVTNKNFTSNGGSSHHNNTNSKSTTISRNGSQNHSGGPLGLPAPRRITSSSISTLHSNNADLRKSSLHQQKSFLKAEEDDCDDEENAVVPAIQYDVKYNAKMLSLEKIRPTIGMNLSKNEICGAQVHVWDLGGKLHDLWERYYDDADAVLFVWRLNRHDVLSAKQSPKTIQQLPHNVDNVNSDNVEDDTVRVTAEQQLKILEEVRSSVPDDIPFCLLGNIFQLQPPYNCEPDVLYSTSHILPHYHNPLQALFMVNAVSGQGIKTAVEWLISTAKRQQRIRKRLTDE
jgi:GTPase SAR1 family protein